MIYKHFYKKAQILKYQNEQLSINNGQDLTNFLYFKFFVYYFLSNYISNYSMSSSFSFLNFLISASAYFWSSVLFFWSCSSSFFFWYFSWAISKFNDSFGRSPMPRLSLCKLFFLLSLSISSNLDFNDLFSSSRTTTLFKRLFVSSLFRSKENCL